MIINMPEVRQEKEMSRGSFQYKFWKSSACMKWYDIDFVFLVGGHLEELTLTSTVYGALKGSAYKVNNICLNTIKQIFQQ